ncbi:MAG: metallophosphoesterase, partial [Marinoscillum sp.]
SVKLSQHSYGFGYYYISDKEHPKETEAEKFEALCFPCYDMSNNIPPTSSQNTSSGNALSLFPETYTSVALPRFSMIISSDPQFFWSPYYEKENNYNKSQKQERAIKTFDHFAQSVNAHNQMLNNRIKGVIINGDITRNGNWPHFAQIDRSFSKVKLPLYWGLGNHDVQNPAEAYKWMYNKLIPNHGVQVDLEKSLTNFYWDGTDSDQYDQISSYSGSLSYTWTESGVRFIQLQFHPEYEILPGILSPKWIENNVRYDLKVKNSITWLSSVLMVAQLKGEKVIINMHVPPADRHIEKEFGQIVRTFQNEILAIFAGHLHYNDCRLPDFNSVPVFVSGAIFNNNYYLLSFYDNAFGVNKCYSANGKVNISGERWIIPY